MLLPFRKYLFPAALAFGAVLAPQQAAAKSDVDVLDRADEARFSAAFQAIRAARWDEAKQRIADLPRGGLRALATAELYLAKDSPLVEGPDLQALLNEAPWLPQGGQLAALATRRGVTALPAMPQEQRFAWLGSAPVRGNPDRTNDPAAASLRDQVHDRITHDDPAGAEALLNAAQGTLRSDSLTEMQKRIAWSYYIENDDRNALRLSRLAMAGAGEWAAQAEWVYALASWRMGEYAAAQTAFANVAARTSESAFKAAALYWAGRSAMASGRPELVQPALQSAARHGETFYGILAAEALGMEPVARRGFASDRYDAKRLAKDDKLHLVFALEEIGEDTLADETLKFFARTDDGRNHDKYLAAAREMGLPQTQLWLAHNGPSGTKLDSFARYPDPKWQPDGGWRVDKALVYAHALQESRFRSTAVSPAGALGLLQLMPGTARDLARRRGWSLSTSDYYRPDINLEFGQSYMEQMRDRAETGGLLPKVIAAYNAGPAPVGRWAYEVNDQGDPLLFIESIPYWETRGYVNTVMRNFWMYEAQEKPGSTSRTGLAQNMWPRYPGLAGPTAVRLVNPKADGRIANR